MIRIFIIDDHPSITDSLHYSVHPSRDEIEIVGDALNVHEAVLNVKPEDLDIFILDLYIPASEPVDNIRILKRKFPDKKIIIYTGEISSRWARIMAKEGASAYLTKNLESLSVKTAILKVYNGETVFPDYMPSMPVSSLTEDPADYFSFTIIQKEVVELLFKGLTKHQIADNLGINTHKVNYLLKQIRRKLKVRNNQQLIVKILQQRTDNPSGQ